MTQYKQKGPLSRKRHPAHGVTLRCYGCYANGLQFDSRLANFRFLCFFLVPCKRQSSVNSGAWLRKFDDVSGVEKSCVAKRINGKKAKKNDLLLQINMRFPQTFKCIDVCHV